MRRLAGLLLAAVVLTACGEPPIDVTIPARKQGVAIADLAGVLDAAALQGRIDEAAAEGLDVVALTYETPQASCGEAYRAATEFVNAWEADVAIVAVARPGDFASDAQDRQRCVGIQPRDPRGLGADLRERIAEEIVPPLAGENEWTAAFDAAIEAVLAQ